MSNLADRANKVVHDFSSIVQGAASPFVVYAFAQLNSPFPSSAQFRQVVIFHQGDLAEYLVSHANLRSIVAQYQNEQADAIEFRLHRKGQDNLIGHAVIVPTAYPDLHRMVFVATAEVTQRIQRKVTRSLYPKAMPVYFKQDEIETALINLEQDLGIGHQVAIVEVVQKTERSAGQKSILKKMDTSRAWIEKPVRKFIGCWLTIFTSHSPSNTKFWAFGDPFAL